jgi:hypothetical protein
VSAHTSWHSHISTVINKSNAVNAMIKRAVGFNAPHSVTVNLYSTLSRSILEYCAPLWSPQSAKYIQQIEKVQRHITKYILHYPDLCYKERCIKLGILPLTYRREMLDLILFFKCVHGLTDLNISDFVQFYDTSARCGSRSFGLKLLKSNPTRTDCFRSSYFNRLVSEWNALPSTIRQSSSLNCSS